MRERKQSLVTSRTPQEEIPADKRQRDMVRAAVRDYIKQHTPVGPLSIEELRAHSKKVLDSAGIDEKYIDFTAVVFNNEVWRAVLAKIQYKKRLLLLPKCFRDTQNCQGTFDEVGLICAHCGRCMIDEFSTQAGWPTCRAASAAPTIPASFNNCAMTTSALTVR